MNISLDNLANFIQQNSMAVLIVFFVSAVANVIQIGTYFRDRRQLLEQKSEGQRLSKLIDTYEYILNIAQKSMTTEEKLAEIEKEIDAKRLQANELNERIKVIEQAAQRALVSQAIEYNLSVLKEAHEEINRLREQYNSLGQLPDIPEASRAMVEQEVQVAIRNPYSFPRPFVYRSALLVLLLILFPTPLLGLFLPLLIRTMILTLIEAVSLFPNERLQRILWRRVSIVCYISIFAAWASVVSTIKFLSYVPGPPEPFVDQIWNILDILFLPVVLLVSYQHWRIMRFDVLKAASEMLSDATPNALRFKR